MPWKKKLFPYDLLNFSFCSICNTIVLIYVIINQVSFNCGMSKYYFFNLYFSSVSPVFWEEIILFVTLQNAVFCDQFEIIYPLPYNSIINLRYF